MFKPLRLVYLEATPEKGSETLTTKNFLGELKKFGYDKEKAKEAVCKSALTRKGGYELTKAEALVAAGKITTLADLDNAAAYALNVGDIDDFLSQYGGDKYVKRLFAYGTSKMERDFMAKKQNFEADKKKGGTFEGLKRYATFEDAFNAGFYKEFAVDFDSIMEKGLSVSEYRQRDERFRKLEKKVKKMEKEPEYPEGKLPGVQQKVEEKKVEAPQPKGDLKKSPAEPLQTIERKKEVQKGPTEQEKKEEAKEIKLGMVLEKLSVVAKECRKSDMLIPELVKKYKLEEINGSLDDISPIVENTDKEDEYVDKFLKKVKVKNYIPQSGENLVDFVGTAHRMSKEAMEELLGGYDELLTKRHEDLVSLETALYAKGDGSSDPRAAIPEIQDEETRKAQEAIRLENIKAAENACPEIKDVQVILKDLSKAAAQWRFEAMKLKTE